MDLAKLEGNHDRYVPANREFHFTIYRAAGSDTLISVIESLWLQIGPYFNLLKTSGNWTAANEDHRRICEALKQGNASAAQAALESDIAGAATILTDVLTRRLANGSK